MPKLTREQRIARWKRLAEQHDANIKQAVFDGDIQKARAEIDLRDGYWRRIAKASKKGRN